MAVKEEEEEEEEERRSLNKQSSLATYLDAARQKQERPTRQLGNDPAL